jgi:pyruvate kinase
MLNKGPFIEDTIRTLNDILSKMREHQTKKQSRLRRLRSWYGGWPDAS